MAVCNVSCCCVSGDSLFLAGKASGLVKTSSSGKNAPGSSKEIVSLQKDMCISRKVAVVRKPYMSSRRSGGESQDVRRETLTGGEELLERAGEVSRDRTRP
jgi:hypothetical protein